MKGCMRFSLISVLLLMAVCVPVALHSKGVRMDLVSRGQIGIGDKFYITVRVTDIKERPDIGRSTRVPGAEVLFFTETGSGSSSVSVNGHTESNFYIQYTMTCKATAKGKHTFGPISVGGVRSNSLTYNIGNGAPARTQQGGVTAPQTSGASSPTFIGTGNGNLFLRSSVSKSKVYEQEAIVYTVKLYSTYSNIRFVGATASPKFDGFVVEESKDISNQLTFESYNGRQYATAVIARYVIFPQMKGSLKVTGNTYTVAVDEREYYRDQFWGTMSVSKPIQLNVKPNDLNVEVIPLPQPQPSDFSGAVGKFSIRSSLSSRSLKTNQAASIIYTVSGTGNLKYIKLPDLNPLFPKELEVFTPETKVNAKVSGGSTTGSVTFDCSIMPLEIGSYRIPAIEFVYFDPLEGKYVTAKAAGYEVDVAQGRSSSKSQTNSVIRFNDSLKDVGTLTKNHGYFIGGFPYLLWYIVPSLLFVIIIMVYRKRIADNADMMAVKSRRASKIAARRLKKALRYMVNGDQEGFYDEMLASLWGYIADRLKMQMSDLNRDNISSRLAVMNIDELTITDFISVVDECEFAKYAPSAVSGGMKSVYDKGVGIIDSLETKFKKV